MQEIDENIVWANELKKNLLKQNNEEFLKAEFRKTINERFSDGLKLATDEYSRLDDEFWNQLERILKERRGCLDLWK